MPEKTYSKIRPLRSKAPNVAPTYPWAELQVTSNFSFLRGGSHPEELVFEAERFGYRAIALTDLNTLAGIVRAHVAAKGSGLRFIVGARLTLFESETGESGPSQKSRSSSKDHKMWDTASARARHVVSGSAFGRLLRQPPPMISVLVYPTSREAYASLCRILSIGKRRAAKGECYLFIEDFLQNQKDLACILIPPSIDILQDERHLLAPEFSIEESNLTTLNVESTQKFFDKACKLFLDSLSNEYLSLAFTKNYDKKNQAVLKQIKESSAAFKIPLVVVNDIYYHTSERKALQDVLCCIRNHCTIQSAGFRLLKNSNRHLKSTSEIARIYKDEPKALNRVLDIEEMTRGFSLDELKYEYPDEICPNNKTPFAYLKELTWKGAKKLYPNGISAKTKSLLQQEFKLIKELNYEKYFLTCYDIVRFARSRDILCQGRGAAANSAVCFCLGITSVDPEKIDLLFASFVSKERDEPPDIDIDFEHERREEVIQYIYSKYGRERAGLTAEVVSYKHRSAVRDVGKALGLSIEIVDKIAKSIHRWTSYEVPEEFLKELGLETEALSIKNTLLFAKQLLGFPRHLSQHVGGFIISLRPLSESVPILNASMPDRTIIEWDKDDIEALGMLKIDILALGMLSCIKKALSYINEQHRTESRALLALHTIPPEDPDVYDMICESDTVGVFQIESRAQMSMLPRLKPRCFYDLVIEVAIVRPGPIHGNMVHPFLRRKSGLEKVIFPDEEVKAILGKTLGVPLFQEQAMRLAIVLADFSPGEAEQLRRAMAAWKKNKTLIASFKERIVKGMKEKGYTKEFAETCVDQIKGFSEYGFPESHAASFALLVYASAWIKCHYPVAFAAALLNSQPMGFYAPSQIIQDLKAHGFSVLPIDINSSEWDCTIEIPVRLVEEPYYIRVKNALRLGMRMIKGINKEQACIISNLVKATGKLSSIRELWFKAYENGLTLRKSTLLNLARADAFSSLGLSRREALWEISSLPEKILPLDPFEKAKREPIELASISLQEEMFQDYKTTGLSLKAHPIAFIRDELKLNKALSASQLRTIKKGKGLIHVSAGGLVIVRQRPGSAKGIVFLTLEDETGTFNIIIRPKIFEEYTNLIVNGSALLVHGFLEKIGNISYINAQKIQSLDDLLIQKREISLPSKSYSY
ncbi:MAG: error-prone DNA polymerase [SAR324 cluster bacterium]|uniref:DNA polymerase III subunit alpha n=1 Tax=SAR324 cluster bacterium TaxID=2024889 RepID=A0A7X9IKY3_9DELT|nr:error-prone DNA polymerase [SAR324 cluster bacterium]